jgi:hypothetical protein
VLALVAALALPHSMTRASEHRESVSLESVIAASDLIVVAIPATPPFRTVVVPLAPRGDGTPVAPFQYQLGRWIVREVVSPSAEAPRDPSLPAAVMLDSGEWYVPTPPMVGEVLEIESSDVDIARTVHERLKRDGARKIPIFVNYQSMHPPRPEDRGARVLFLKRSAKRLIGTYGGASEGLAALPAIKQALVTAAQNRR